MSARSLFRRRDPFWEVDGPAARRSSDARRLAATIAFAVALAAVAGAAFAWSVELGLAASLGIRADARHRLIGSPGRTTLPSPRPRARARVNRPCRRLPPR